jgi:hypothetical protein
LACDCLVGAVTTRETFFKPRERSGPKLIHRGAIVAFEVSLCVKLKHLFIPSFDCSVRSHGFRGGASASGEVRLPGQCECRHRRQERQKGRHTDCCCEPAAEGARSSESLRLRRTRQPRAQCQMFRQENVPC